MAQEEIIFKVGVDTGDSKTKVDNVGDAFDNVNKKVELTGRSFKELQDELKKVTQELQSLNPNSKEFENLTKKANELKREMKAVGDSMNETTNDTNKSFTNLRKELKQLTIQLQNLDPASKEFETVAKRAGQIKEQMRGVADTINDADPEKFGGKFQRTAEGIAGAFSAVTGAQVLFGQQSEEIEKQMLKVQGAIALTQGISAMKELRNDATDLAGSIKNKVVTAFQSLNASQIANAQATGTMTTLQKAYNVVIGSSTGALKGFKLALASTGIGALILAVGYLIANFDKLKGSMSKGLTTAKSFETSTSRQAEAARYASDNFAEYERTLVRLGYTEEQINSKRKARYKDAIIKTEKEIEASKKVYQEQLKNLKIVEGFDKWGFNATGRLFFGDEDTAKAQQQKIKD
jgi:chromosome segregation ATPase